MRIARMDYLKSVGREKYIRETIPRLLSSTPNYISKKPLMSGF
jgi:hypothetical protein